MKALLDTNAFIWLLMDQGRLSDTARSFIRGNNELSLSIVSVWEIVIKVQIGRLRFASQVTEVVEQALAEQRIALLPITMKHVSQLQDVPLTHRDPFDRMLVAQALAEDLPILSSDRALRQYKARVLW